MGVKHLFLSGLAAFVLSALTGCKLLPDDNLTKRSVGQPARLMDLTLVPVRVQTSQLPKATPQVLAQRYQTLLARIDDPVLRAQVSYRLADLKMLIAESQQEQGSPLPAGKGYYDQAIAGYQEALQGLAQHPDKEVEAELLYQLSRAHDMQGQGAQSQALLAQLIANHPDSTHLGEALFRQGEQAFNRSDYAAAIEAYRQVVTEHRESDFYATAAYMLGWSYFKREAFSPALNAFGQMLDASFAGPDQQRGADLGRLGLGQQKLVQDTLRMVAMLFEYQGSEADIPGFFKTDQSAVYAHLVYGELALQHLDNDRYKDSADVYLRFTQQYPRHPKAIDFFVRHIDAFILGDFPTQVMPAKARFVEAYGINGPHWQAHPQAIDYLHPYLKELAQYEHSLAQMMSPGRNGPSTGSNADRSIALSQENWQQKQTQAYAAAASWYREFLETFPQDPDAAAVMFNLAESLYEANELLQAVDVYQQYAGLAPKPDNAADAAYSAIVALSTLVRQSADRQQDDLSQRYAQSQVAFTVAFGDDPRAISIAQVMMEQAFDGQAHEQTRHWGEWLLDRHERIDGTLLAKARLTLAHTDFATGEYAAAEAAYQRIVAGLAEDDPARTSLNRNRAIGQYQLAKALVAHGNGKEETSTDAGSEQNVDWRSAINHLAMVRALSPDPQTVRNAHFDMATYWLNAEAWAEATRELLSFETAYRTDALAKDIPEKLILAFEKQQHWDKAAGRLKAMWQQQPKTELGREALYQAAEYFERAGQRQDALKSFRSYAHAYPEPFAPVTEARFTMSQFYLDSGEDAKRRYWLKKLMDGHANAGALATERSQTLAAMSALVFAEDTGTAFKRIELSQPLKKSLAKKRKAMEKAIAAYDKVLGYGVRQYSTDANYKLANIYQTLAADLMASSRPKGLSELELEQYDLLLEEQAYPFEEQAIALHAANARRAWQGIYDSFVQRSFAALAGLNPGRYRKTEQQEELTPDVL